MKARKTHDMESCKEADIEENVELPKESLQEIEFVSIGEKDSVVESIFDSKDKEYDAFNLDVSLTLLDTETDEVDAEFLEALTEIEGKKWFPCCLLLEDLAGVVESIKTNLIVGDLYGPVINTAINTKLPKLSNGQIIRGNIVEFLKQG